MQIGSKPGKIPELDGLRAFAILLVLLFHFATYYREHFGSYFVTLFHNIIQNFMFNAWLGVDLFFVLSGYLIFHHLKSAPDSNKIKTFGHYALKRILRTFPLYYAIIILISLGIIPYYKIDTTWPDLLIHLLFLQDYFGNTLLVPLWSLATEEKFYLLAPFLWLLTKNSSPIKNTTFLMLFIVMLLILKSASIYQANPITNYIVFFSDYRAPFHFAIVSIGFGVIGSLLTELKPPDSLPLIALVATIITITILFFTDMYRADNWHWVNLNHFLITLFFAVWVWLAVTNMGSWYLKFLTGRGLRVISTLSYALYLTHYAVLPWTYKLHKTYVQSEEAWIHAITFFMIYIFLTTTLSLLLHYLVEKPFLILKERL